MSFFDTPKFPEPFKPEPLWQMNTCPTCPNDLVCHDQGECLRPTPETDEAQFGTGRVSVDFARRLERERNEACELLASEKATRNAIIAKGIETERQRNEARQAFAIATDQLVQVQGELRQAREENAKLREALENCREDSIELLGERDWWKEEPRCGYQERYSQTAKNIQIADALLTP